MLTAVPGLVSFADPPDSNDKHLPFFAREEEVAGQAAGDEHPPAAGLGAERGPAQGPARRASRTTGRDRSESLEQTTSQTDADDLLRWMTDHDRFTRRSLAAGRDDSSGTCWPCWPSSAS